MPTVGFMSVASTRTIFAIAGASFTPGRVHPSFYDPERQTLSRMGVEYLVPIFGNALGAEDMEYARQNLFRRSNLTEPYHSVNVDVNKRIFTSTDGKTPGMCHSLEFEDQVAGAQRAGRRFRKRRAADGSTLEGDIRLLDGLLDSTIRRLEGEASFRLLEEIREAMQKLRSESSLAAARALSDRLITLDLTKLRLLSRAFSTHFDLVNIAEQQARLRALSAARRQASQPLPETPAQGLCQLREQRPLGRRGGRRAGARS